MFWRVEDFQRVISAYVRDLDAVAYGSVVSLADFQCRKTLLKTALGEQHLLFHANRHVAQVRCVGDDIRLTPFALEPVVDQFPAVERPQKLIRRLANLYRNRLVGGPRSQWTVEAIRHRDALIAVDLRNQSWIYQDVARFIHGDKLVDEEWTNPNTTLKNRTIRSYKRGLRMIDGGYRTLLT